MATVSTITYNNIATAVAITSCDSLAVDGYASSALVDNQVNRYMDVNFGGLIQAGALTVDGTVNVYLVGSWDGVEFTGGVDGGDAAITWGTTGNTAVNSHQDMVLVGVIAVDATDDNTDIRYGPFSVANAFGGIMPLEWAVVFENKTDAILHATGTNNKLEYTGITYTST